MPKAPWGGFRILALLRVGPLQRALKGLDGSGILRLGVFLALGLGFEAVLYGLFRALALSLWSQPLLGPLLGARVLGLGLDLLFGLILLTSLPALLGGLLQSGPEADFFVSSPLLPRAYFSFRLAEACLGVAWVLPLLWVPALLALRRVLGGGLGFTLWGLLAPLPLAALGVGLGAGLLCFLLKFLPPERLRSGLRWAAGLAFAVFMLILCFSHPERLSDPQKARSVEDYLAGLRGLDSPYWPGTWTVRAILWLPAAPLKALACFAGLALPALGCGLGVVRLFGANAFEWWQKGQGAASGGGKGGHGAFRSVGLRAPWRVLLEHGWVALSRARSQLAQALLLTGLLALFTVSLGRLPLGHDQQLKDWLFLPVCCVAQALLVAVAARFVYPAASLDHGARALLFQAPPGPAAHLG
ncbi:MAG: putative ABC transporter permease subunit, partial [bacterium]